MAVGTGMGVKVSGEMNKHPLANLSDATFVMPKAIAMVHSRRPLPQALGGENKAHYPLQSAWVSSPVAKAKPNACAS